MGILRRSINKSKAMKNVEKVLIKQNHSDDELMQAYEDLYTSILDMNDKLSALIREYSLTAADIQHISYMMYLCGFGKVKGDFIPVSLVSFEKPLRNLLEESKIGTDESEDMFIAVTRATKYL